MATNFPTGLDTFVNPGAADAMNSATAALKHHTQHDNINDAVAAIEAKVGVNTSAVTTSLDYRVRTLESAPAAVQVGPGVLRATGNCATVSPELATSTLTLLGGSMHVTFFTATASYTTAGVRYNVAGAATSSGANTGIGLFSVSGADAGTMIASVVSATLFTTTGPVSKSWASSVAITAGSRYALAFLNITGSGSAILVSTVAPQSTMATAGTGELALVPRWSGRWGSQTALGNFTAANLNGANSEQTIYAVLT